MPTIGSDVRNQPFLDGIDVHFDEDTRFGLAGRQIIFGLRFD
ncbi:hypothetical protein [Bacillus glycinifermentans]|nr:hypothetical protein [Bacillus glycinifermentans]